LMAAAGVTAQTTQVHSGEEALNRITGAQTPSGIPVVITAPVVERAKRSTSSRGRRRPVSAARRVSLRQSTFDAAA
ncbi:DEAD/DEAH box helicase, partial [Streptomyces sp. NPDC055254]